MKLIERTIPGLLVLESPTWGDERGFFREWFKAPDFDDASVSFTVRQANLSMSSRDVVRGLHYSVAPQGQAKVVTCAYGALDDVIVDVRVGSPTFGVVDVVHLEAGDGRSVYLPEGVAHGFGVISEHAALTYLLSSPFDATHELEINPLDPAVAVPWTLQGEPILSAKDADAPTLADRLAADQLPRFAR